MLRLRSSMFVGSIVLAISLWASSGCLAEFDGYEEYDVDSIEQEVVVDNDAQLNSVFMNGIRVNGIRVNGIRVNGIRVNGASLFGSVFSGTREDNGQLLIGQDFDNSMMEAVGADSSVEDVRVVSSRTDALSGIRFYRVEHFSNGNWRNICDTNSETIPVRGRWDNHSGDHDSDNSVFTFACRGAALAKCAEWGYKRWGTEWEHYEGEDRERALSYFHQACTRMVRGDYCGNGVPHTRNGTAIDVWDALGIQEMTEGSGMLFEAEWTPSGASCVKRTRWSDDAAGNGPDKDYILSTCETRWVGPDDTECGSDNSTFKPANGFDIPQHLRNILRNASFINYN